MHFVHRLRTIWSWLPSFRAVAETEHLPTAAQELAVVPSSLSRTVKQLEDELGVALFDRTTRTLVLNDAGRTLLVAAREAMRTIDDALSVLNGDQLRGRVGAVATADLAHAVVIPASAALMAAYPGLVVSCMVARPEDMADLLARGDADAALTTRAPGAHPDLVAIELGSWTCGLYARRGRAIDATPRFVIAGNPGDHDDGWPASSERSVAAWVADQHAALDLCARGDLVTIAFDALVRRSPVADQLQRIESPVLASQVISLLHRRAIGRHPRTEEMITAIRNAFDDISS